jgi:hypothetical protein
VLARLSWSKDATVTYDRGRFSRKSDASRYRRPDETMSYLEGSGGAMLHYYCECED